MPKATLLEQLYRIGLVSAFSVALLQAQEPPVQSVLKSAEAKTANIQQRVSTSGVHSSDTFEGRLSCAGLATGSYRCTKNQTIWACTLQCAGERSRYVLQTEGGQLFPVTGRLDQLQHFAADEVVVTGDLTESGIIMRSIKKFRD